MTRSTKEGDMARRSHDTSLFPVPDGFGLGLGFLQARRAQNLSLMRVAEQSLRILADLQRTAGPSGASLARLWTAQAGFVRDSAEVYGVMTAHLAR
jgi:hypothetical protein